MTLREEWIAALRDPKAKQTQKFLARPDGSRCCLGVLCDLAVAKGLLTAPHETIHVNDQVILQYKEADASYISYSIPPSRITDLVGLSSYEVGLLTHANDIERASFEDIANALEADHLEIAL